MKVLPSLLLAAAGMFLLGSHTPADAQVSFGISVGGPAPVCPFGYFSYAPYNCSPYGYYGPEWFNNGVSLGAGPWFHGPVGFYGHVNRRYDPHYGYRGPFPHHGGWREPRDHFHHFHGRQFHDGHDYVRGGRPRGDFHGGPPR